VVLHLHRLQVLLALLALQILHLIHWDLLLLLKGFASLLGSKPSGRLVQL
jgi:hypothetical protein